MVWQGAYQKPRHDPLGLRHQQCDVECISVQMREKLQGCCHIIPTIRTHNGFKYLTVLFPVRLPRVNLACLGCRRLTTGVILLVISNSVRLPPSLMSYGGTQSLRSAFVLSFICRSSFYVLYLRRSVYVAFQGVAFGRYTICSVGRKSGSPPPLTIPAYTRYLRYPITR